MRRASWMKSGSCSRWSAGPTRAHPSQCDQGKGDSPPRQAGGAHRTVALCRGRPDAHRRHRHRICPDPADRSRPRPDGVPLRKALCVLAAPGSAAFSGGKPLRHKKTDGTGSTRVAAVLRMAAVSLHSIPPRPATRDGRLPSSRWPAGSRSRHRKVRTTSTWGKSPTKPASGNAAWQASQMPLSPLVSNWFHKLQPPELRGLFQTSPGS